jgi:hypothetical protein
MCIYPQYQAQAFPDIRTINIREYYEILYRIGFP